jgi:hypothetical protein
MAVAAAHADLPSGVLAADCYALARQSLWTGCADLLADLERLARMEPSADPIVLWAELSAAVSRVGLGVL